MMIMDVACLYDLYIHNVLSRKDKKIQRVESLLNSKGFNCVVDSVIIGSLGSVHCKALGVLLILEIKEESGKDYLNGAQDQISLLRNNFRTLDVERPMSSLRKVEFSLLSSHCDFIMKF